MRKIFFLCLFFCLSAVAFGQDLSIQHSDKGMYITHTVAAKENWYSIGRLYTISPKDIAAFNGADMTRGLSIGQSLMIPLTAANFNQSAAAKGRPVYYTVGDKEGLYRVTVKNGKATMADMRKWNNLKTDAIASGQKLVVGFIGAAPAGAAMPAASSTAATPAPHPAPRKDSTVVVRNEAPADKPKPITDTASPTQDKTVTILPTPVAATGTPRTAVNDGHGGYFHSQYEQQTKAGKDATLSSGIFKTTSGWQDTKYYILIDAVEPGTLVKVANPQSGKTIYAKVLGGMSGIRQNNGYDVRISNAAASVLGAGETEKFNVRVQY